jgi:hypothetical protein
MPSLERTAYPRFGRVITSRELESAYTPSEEERAWAKSKTRTSDHLLGLAVLLKCFQAIFAQRLEKVKLATAVAGRVSADAVLANAGL